MTTTTDATATDTVPDQTPAETEPRVPAVPPRATGFSDTQHEMLDALGEPAHRGARALLFREMVRTGLDPFARHLYINAKKDKDGHTNYTIETTIDGMRVVARRQSTYRGTTDVQWCGADGEWRNVWRPEPNGDKRPYAARVTVFVDGLQEPVSAVAILTEFWPSTGPFMWVKMPSHMIGKVVEALALRKAYPEKLSGIYTDDEMGQSAEEREKAAALEGFDRTEAAEGIYLAVTDADTDQERELLYEQAVNHPGGNLLDVYLPSHAATLDEVVNNHIKALKTAAAIVDAWSAVVPPADFLDTGDASAREHPEP